MTAMAMNEATSAGRGERALRWIGDLDHPFYSDERNRYVWYEASAIAFQLLFLSSYVMAGLLLLLFGADGMPYVLAMFMPAIITAVVFQGYLQRKSAEYWPQRNDFRRPRGQLAAFSAVFLLAGLIRAVIDLQGRTDSATARDSFFGGAIQGMIAGLLVGPIVAVAVVAYKRRQQAKADEIDEF